jgi:hypothetical protein
MTKEIAGLSTVVARLLLRLGIHGHGTVTVLGKADHTVISGLKSADHTVIFLGSAAMDAALSPTMAVRGQPSKTKWTGKWWSY